MNKLRETRISAGAALVLCALTGAAGALGSAVVLGWHTPEVAQKLREIDRLAGAQYIGELDAQEVADYAAVGYVTGLNDKWSAYIPAEQYEAYRMNSEGQGCGIGVSVLTGEQGIHVYLVYDDAPAARAGIQKGDWIVGAAGLTVEKDGAAAVVDAIQGDEGTEVTVSIRRDGTDAVQDYTMTRAVVTQKMAWGELLENQIGYLRIESFHAGAAAQFQAALDALVAEGARALVLDVRHNGGGRVKEMSDMLDPLLPEGTIITLRTKEGEETVYSSDAELLDLPLAVLIDDQSISAAEFFAAALQEYDRAVLVGTHTTGKGRAQRTFELSDGSALNLSIEEYFTPQGNSLADVGIAPDEEIALPEGLTDSFFFLPHAQDTQLQKAVELLR